MDAPFRFGLQRVRDLRAHDEELAQEQFAASLSQRVRGQAMLMAAEQQLREARDETVAGLCDTAISGMELLSRQVWVERLERSREAAAIRLQGFEHDLQGRRADLTTASQRRQVLDKLEARQRETHRRACERREGAELDEMALRGFARRRRAA